MAGNGKLQFIFAEHIRWTLLLLDRVLSKTKNRALWISIELVKHKDIIICSHIPTKPKEPPSPTSALL